ncbi:Hypothetical predicted protein [Paramuricea clavata]|uniref:Uncharacterized protein n=1 Tax=Paramuricea clavata TaxID=317549 RepID=A0A7D9HVM7_PARCT|nr:Hypothetical predicted protein [Paramuricea clavata]
MTEPSVSTPLVTKPSEQPKVKDPCRVTAGKRLAAISQQAKANKKAKREEAEREVSIESDDETSTFSLKKLGLISTIIVGFGTLYFMWRSQKKEEEEEPIEEKEEVPTKQNPAKVHFDGPFD